MLISSLMDFFDESFTNAKGITGALIAIGVIGVIVLIGMYLHNPYRGTYPYCNIRVDISRKRNVAYLYVIDTLLWRGYEDPCIPLNRSNCTALSRRAIEDAQQAVIDWDKWAKQDLERRWAK